MDKATLEQKRKFTKWCVENAGDFATEIFNGISKKGAEQSKDNFDLSYFHMKIITLLACGYIKVLSEHTDKTELQVMAHLFANIESELKTVKVSHRFYCRFLDGFIVQR